ncbi:HAD-IG family 5'-nucleotidase [bacterium]|nr:HAD-IG family 5'-nucleotidase [bacterium]
MTAAASAPLSDDDSGLFPEDLEGLLRSDQRVDRVHKVYITRSLKLSSIRGIGFDMDHTLAIYKKQPIEELAFSATARKLAARPGYPPSMANLKYDREGCVRGLIVDKELGNILKLDKYNYVALAYHGTRRLLASELKKQYAEDIIKFDPNKHYSVDTLFSVPEVFLYAKLVDFIDSHVVRAKTYGQAFIDVRACIDEAHRDGSIKEKVCANPERYVNEDLNLPLTLHKFRVAGKKLFLLTNSDVTYVDVVLGFLLNGKLPGYTNWRDYFDVSITLAGKPGFYKRAEPSTPLNGSGETPKVFVGGNAHDLEERMGVSGDRILYFGDHTYDDILKTKRQFNWRTAMIVPGLAAEIKISQSERKLRTELYKLFQERDTNYVKITRLYSLVAKLRADKIHNYSRKSPTDLARLDRHTRSLTARIAALERNLSNVLGKINVKDRGLFRRYNKFWGSEFSAGNEISRFAGQIADFACIYTGKVSNLLAYSPNKYFQKKRIVMPHETE